MYLPDPSKYDDMLYLLDFSEGRFVFGACRSVLVYMSTVNNHFSAQEAATTLANSWEKVDRGAPLPRRGAKLRNPNAKQHPVYASQELYSVYVHVPPEFKSYPESSLFYGREITPSMNAERFHHSLGMLSLLLLEAALLDETVANARFAVISESDAPLYNAGALYLQLMLSHRSRLGPTYSFEELLHVDGVRRYWPAKHVCQPVNCT
jgi:Core-2/I-Branching enzyme